jgi:hypothetical protein
MSDPAAMVGAELPGDLLVLALDTGGERWHLAGRPLHAGDVIELLTEGPRATCRACDGESSRCASCGGRGYLFAPAWIAVRFEYVNAGDGTGEASLYLRLPAGRFEARHAIRARRGDALRCRWPRRGGEHGPAGG